MNNGKTIDQIMVPIEQYPRVRHNATLGDAIYEMVSLDVALIPVLQDRSVVGVVRSVDVFQEVAQFLGRVPTRE